MPFAASAVPNYFPMSRRSFDCPLSDKNQRAVDLGLTHRSIQSDPGVFELLSRISDSSLISDRVMEKIEAVRAGLDLGKITYSAGLGNSLFRKAALAAPTYKYFPTNQCLGDLEVRNYEVSVERRRNQDNRRVCVLDSQLHKLSNQGRVISTSLSSSTASVYSEEDDFSECPSIISTSRRNSYCCPDNDDDSTLKRPLQSDKNNNNRNANNHGVVSIDGQLIVVNLGDLSPKNEPVDVLSDDRLKIEQSAFPHLSDAVKVHPERSVTLSLQPRDIASDNEDEEYEQCALSEMWHLEEDGYRWSRMDSKASSIGSPESRLSSAGLKLNLDGIKESGNGVLSAAVDKDHQPIHYEHGKLSENSPQKNDDVSDLAAEGDAVKSKNTFLQRVGGDLKKLGSFRKKDSFQRANSVDGSIEESHFARNRYGRRNKSLRKKNDKVEIGKPVLQCGQDRLAQFRCVPIDSTGASPKDVHSLREGRKNSLHSLTSSTSSSGGASSVSTPASRIRAYTDDFSLDLGEISPGILHRNRTLLEMGANTSSRSQKDSSQDRENSVFFVPRGYKPGTFPRSLREMSNLEDVPPAFSSSSASSTRSHSASDTISAPLSHDKKSARPVSVYDNLTDTALNGNASAHDFMKPLDPGSPFGGVDDAGVYNESMETLETPLGFDAAFWGVDDIVEYASNLQQKMGTRKSENEEDDVNIPDRLFPVPTGVRLSYSTENIASLDDEADSNSITNSDPGPQPRMRWNSLKKEMSASSATSESLQLHTLSVGQLMMLRRLSLLKLTALMENYAFTSSKGTLSWSVPRFMRRAKVPDYKDKSVFGVPLLQNVQRFGQPLPLCIQHALAYLRSSALDQVGLFRKPGVKGRILKLRERCENQPDLQNFEECSVFDVADLVKQYFRELPDPLMTMKLSETFIGIFLYVPEEMRLKTLKAAIMILPDETREILKTLLCFLSDVAAHSDENRMTASNLATCFAPSLFHINSARLMASAALPKTRKMQSAKTSSTALTKPDLKEMNENKASTTCLAFMIEHFDDMFKICEDAMTQCRLSVMQQTDDVLATEIGFAADEEDFYSDFHAYVDRTVTQTMREEQRISQNKGGWQSVASIPGSELLCKKVNDGNPLRLWRSQVEVVGADPKQIMDRILNERHLWDDDLLQWKVVQQPDEKAQLFQMECAEMSPHPTRDYCVFRSWRNDVNSRGAVAIVEVSTGQQTTLGDVRGVILTSRYVIEPTETPQRCTLTHVCRVDTKGRNPEWYNKAYGHIVTQRLMNIRNSLKAVPPKMVSSTQ